MSKQTIAYGGLNAQKFDDGVYDGVRKVVIGEDPYGILYIKIQYVKNGDVVQKEHGKESGPEITETEFEVNFPDEYITSIWGTYRNDTHRYPYARGSTSLQPHRIDFCDPVDRHWQQVSSPMHTNTVSELQFKTSYGRKSWKCGKHGATSKEFVLEGKNGTRLVGLHGCSRDFLDAIGAYFAVVSSVFKHLEPQGGSAGDSWDDGAYDRLRKVCVGEDGDCVSSVEFHYVEGNDLITHRHGKDSKERKEFVLNDHEYLKSVEGTIHKDGFISSLTFRTSMNRSSEEFGIPVGTKFVLEAKGFDKIVGFRGRSRFDRLNALGAHFAVVVAPPVKKLEANGGYINGEWNDGIHDDYLRLITGRNIGNEWDDGIHDHVRMITVTYDDKSVKSVKFEYDGPVIGDTHGDIHKDDKQKEFMLHSTNEYITSVVGHYGQKLPPTESPSKLCLPVVYMTMLTFKTNRATYEVLTHSADDTYVGIPFKFEEQGHKIVGFHGKTEVSLSQIGVYVKPI